MRDLKFHFGKYKGSPIQSAPSWYLRWVATYISPQTITDERVVEACDREWQFREKFNCHED